MLFSAIHSDIYATKGLEYIFVIGFLFLFLVFWIFYGRENYAAFKGKARQVAHSLADWFRVPDGVYYHAGHGFVMPDQKREDLLLVGMDDFSKKLVGPVDKVNSVQVGSHLKQGEKGWSLSVGGKQIDMLSPVSGQVVEVNQETGHLLNFKDDSYEDGWFIKVKPDNFNMEKNHLLSSSLARKWMNEVTDSIRVQSGDLGLVYQDGGRIMDGMAKIIAGDHWLDLIEEHLLTHTRDRDV